MFRFNPFVRVGLCMSAVTLAWPVAAATDDGETMVRYRVRHRNKI
ncbi:colicin I receptor [Salmonella enterica subsp. arizonae]|uniref:Colicin I receptor n=1 Tax=Salmonella enterica subsp. arizonae TaxID=59203 RepID=A0A379T879_SALER|nr:colicin I receptor [Salmonella enterica subsp. arizonae]